MFVKLILQREQCRVGSTRRPDPSGFREKEHFSEEDPAPLSSSCVNGHDMDIQFKFCPECGARRIEREPGVTSPEESIPDTGHSSLPSVAVDQWGSLHLPYLEACGPILNRLSLDNLRHNHQGMAEDGRQLLKIAEDMEALVPPPNDPEIAAASELSNRLLMEVARGCISQVTRPDAQLIRHLLEEHTAQLGVLYGLVQDWKRRRSSNMEEDTTEPSLMPDPSAQLPAADISPEPEVTADQVQAAEYAARTSIPPSPRPTMKGGVVVIGGQPVCSICGGTSFLPRRKTSTKLMFGLVSLVGRPQHIECVACGHLYKRPNR